MNITSLLLGALNYDFLSQEEGVYFRYHAATTDFIFTANKLKKVQVLHGKVTWQIKENVVPTAGAPHRFTAQAIQDTIKETAFEPLLPTQKQVWCEISEEMKEQVIDY